MAQSDFSTVYEVSFQLKSQDVIQNEIIKSVLQRHLKEDADIVELHVDGKTVFSVYFDSYPAAAAIRQKVKQNRLRNISIRMKSLTPREWLTKWKEDFRPFCLTKNITVIPAWLSEEKKYLNRDDAIFIDTHLAFGTGLHPTTKFISGFIEKYKGKFETFLDVGTGTGILAILAGKHGAATIYAIDISEDCILCAKENFLLNKMRPTYLKAVSFEKFRSSRKFDFVAANLITADLIAFRKKLVSFVNPGKYLAISGISLYNFNFIREQFRELALKCLKIEKSEGWVSILYKRIR